MQQPKFKDGEWCFCEFKLQQIQSTDENRITGVSDGAFQMGSRDLTDRCFPITMEIKQASDAAAFWSNKFHSLKNNGLNHPDLNRALISKWISICENVGNPELLRQGHEKLNDFGRAVVQRVSDLQCESVDDVRLFR